MFNYLFVVLVLVVYLIDNRALVLFSYKLVNLFLLYLYSLFCLRFAKRRCL